MYFLYNFFLPILLVLLSPFVVIKLLSDKVWREFFWQRFSINRSTLKTLDGKRPLWFHAASVGEVNASIKLLSEIRNRWPERRLLVSTFTPTGRKAALEKLNADVVIFLPLDLSFIVKSAIKKINPHMLILMETELWPNLIKGCGSGDIPVVIVNGRISDKSIRKYNKLKSLLKEVFQDVSLILTQSAESRERFVLLGAESEKVVTTGNIKFDMQVKKKPVEAVENWGGPIFIAGSTRDGEEEKVLSAYLKARETYTDLKLILAPRHLPRTEEVERTLSVMGNAYEKISQIKGPINSPVLLVDTLGELSSLYPYGDLVFVGGSLVPMGGQNMLEPALCEKPVLFGPHVENFREAARILMEGGGALMVENSDDLARKLVTLLEDPQLRLSMGIKAKASVEEHSGATEKTIDSLVKFLG